ncbi:ISNCY family transposase, partial [Deltaproteobacteria bacterium OttesenSCG-928-M10]|nr:ISNCY family transposase [Deltaproteobacteria bacterium OttesenSCG-928-M10]
MSQHDRDRLKVISRVCSGDLSLRHGSELLGLSYRQASRLLGRYRAEGDIGLIHRGRGQESNRKISASVREQIIALLREHYSDYGPTLASEILDERHQIKISRETLRGWMSEAGLWRSKSRKVKHRRWRERRACFGELVQMDTSEHDWLEGRGEKLYLISMIDDATSRLFARFYPSDSTVNNMDLLKRYIRRHGRPMSLYTDKASHFKYNGAVDIEHQLSGELPRTQIGRALNALGIELIWANSPQAKGRVERQFGTLQDRLVKRLRLEGVSDLIGANECLDRYLIPFWNKRFSVEAQNKTNLHRRLDGLSLDHIFSVHEKRTVANDYTFSLNGDRYQIASCRVAPGLRGGKILVESWLNGRVKASFRGEYLSIKKLSKPVPRRAGYSKPGPSVAAVEGGPDCA